MTKINIPFDCGNLPKREFIKQFNIAFAMGNSDFIIDHVSEDIVWIIHGDKRIEGVDGAGVGRTRKNESIILYNAPKDYNK
ncbi:hypothetical protein [Gelidibacter salicanalis]|uniref:Uncharacterized protein n=1 Tax=Gelidibacter salicanalis TaxID=291193 RepID=A0A934NHJ3_9FLAO|nr:hypothetical protein [Gelidibacter salicanalis]MBJ7879838.1 hypothetical protein [Gelidibacter salicanalis]